MASAHDRSRLIEPLPAHPNVEMQQKRAENLLRAAARGEPDALERFRILHPRPPAPADLTLADAQLVIARGHGFESWAALRRKIEALTRSPVERFVSAIRAGDAGEVRALLDAHADVRAAVNQPLGPFGGRPASMAKKNLPVLDVLLAHGADLNLKSDWAAGPFGLLEYNITPEEAAPLIARGAVVDFFAAAHLDMPARVSELVERDPSLVFARGGDGKSALHCAHSAEIARYLVEHGAAIDARDIDHYSTPAQYLIREAPDVARLLADRGAWLDIFIAVGLRDEALVDRCLRTDPAALDHRTGQGKYTAARPLDAAANGSLADADVHLGDIYRWVFGHNFTVMDAARVLGYADMTSLLWRHAGPAQRLLAACAAADRAAATAVIAEHPGIVASLAPAQMALIAERAHANDTAAVELMLDLGFDARVQGPEDFEALRWAVFLGNPEMTRALLRHHPPLNTPDRRYGGMPLGNCLYGALHGWAADTGDFPATIWLLLDAGEQPRPAMLPTGLDDIDAILRERLAKRSE